MSRFFLDEPASGTGTIIIVLSSHYISSMIPFKTVVPATDEAVSWLEFPPSYQVGGEASQLPDFTRLVGFASEAN